MDVGDESNFVRLRKGDRILSFELGDLQVSVLCQVGEFLSDVQ